MKRYLLLLLCLLLLTGCVNTPMGSEPSQTVQSADQQIFDMLFNIENKITLKLDMDQQELAKMQADYDQYDRNGAKSPVYRMGDLYISIKTPAGQTYEYTIEEVGVRMKGNTSRTDFYNAQSGIYNIVHLKLSFQETFDETAYYGADVKQWEDDARKARKNRTFATLEKLDLRWNRCDDGTYLREYFAYETYRQNGVPAPHTNLASFQWADSQMGVFTINEPVDKRFLEKNLPPEALGGDLYKCGWAGWHNASFTNTDSIGIEDDGAGKFYAYDLKTNKTTSEHSALTHLIRQLNKSSVTKETLHELIDMDCFLNFCAVSYLLGNPDDMRSNYNNFYLYFRADNGKAILIPYDYDRCLGVTTHWNPTGDAVTSDNPFSTKMNADGGQQRNPLILWTVAAGGHYVREYAAALKQIAQSPWFSYDTFENLYNTAKSNYDADTVPGKAFQNAADLHLRFDIDRTSAFSSNGNISIREYLDAKLATVNHYLKQVDKYAGEKPAVPSTWYIRADFTNWQNDSNYAMDESGDIPQFRLVIHKEVRFKVYNDQTGTWYGSECISPECMVPYSTDGHTNIVLQAGTYLIRMDAESNIIYIDAA